MFCKEEVASVGVDDRPRLHCAIMGESAGNCKPKLPASIKVCYHARAATSVCMQTLLKRRATVSQSVEQQQQAASISEPLRRCLGSVDVLFLGLGSILGAGCFVLTGLAAHEDAG